MSVERHTPGPWFGDGTDHEGNRMVYIESGYEIAILPRWWDTGPGEAEIEANARLIAAAPDHALIGWAMCVGPGRWEPWGDGRGEFCINGIRHATRLDEFGMPMMTENLRATILKAKGSTPHD